PSPARKACHRMRVPQVLTGRGAISPLGLSAGSQSVDGHPWRFDHVDAVPRADATPFTARTIPESFAIKDYVTNVGLRRKQRFSHLAIAAAVETHADSGFDERTDKDRIGVVLGTEYGPQRVVADYLDGLIDGGLHKARAGLFTQTVYNVANGQAS